MTTQTPTSPDLLLFPEWVAVLLYLAVIPLGLLVGYLAFRGFRRTDRRMARLLALGLILLTAVDTALGTSVDVSGLVQLQRATPLLRAGVQLLGVAAILYAMYRPALAGGDRETGSAAPVADRPDDAVPSDEPGTDDGGDR